MSECNSNIAFYNKTTLREIIEETCGFEIKEIYLSGDVRKGHEDEQWLRALVKNTKKCETINNIKTENMRR